MRIKLLPSAEILKLVFDPDVLNRLVERSTNMRCLDIGGNSYSQFSDINKAAKKDLINALV